LKALVISVGTGTRAAKAAVEGLANALAYGIRHHNPDLTVFVATHESEQLTLPLIIERAKPKQYDVVVLEDPDDVQATYKALQPKMSMLRAEYEVLVVDYTSGTKAMTAALAILAALSEANELSYITGLRKNGVVQPGTEQIRPIRPYFISAEQKLKTAIGFFNKAQYSTAAAILKEITKVRDPEICGKVEPILSLAEAYNLWDKFQHVEAFKKLRKIKMEELDHNKRFLGELTSRLRQEKEPEPHLIADLLNNAKRRAEKEGKYDDAVARLYRTIELIAQYRLKTKYGIEASSCPREMLPTTLKEKWKIPQEIEKLKIDLQKAYELLEAKGDKLGAKFVQDKSLQNLLTKRNTSILAHGLTPVTKETWQKLYSKTFEYAETAVENLKTLTKMAKHIKIKE